MAPQRAVFPMRFRNPGTRAHLQHLAEQTGTTMTAIIESAVEHEIALRGADLERRLSEALAVVRDYQAERDFDDYLGDIAAGEGSDLDPTSRTTRTTIESGADAVLAAFAR